MLAVFRRTIFFICVKNNSEYENLLAATVCICVCLLCSDNLRQDNLWSSVGFCSFEVFFFVRGFLIGALFCEMVFTSSIICVSSLPGNMLDCTFPISLPFVQLTSLGFLCFRGALTMSVLLPIDSCSSCHRQCLLCTVALTSVMDVNNWLIPSPRRNLQSVRWWSSYILLGWSLRPLFKKGWDGGRSFFISWLYLRWWITRSEPCVSAFLSMGSDVTRTLSSWSETLWSA